MEDFSVTANSSGIKIGISHAEVKDHKGMKPSKNSDMGDTVFDLMPEGQDFLKEEASHGTYLHEKFVYSIETH